MNKVTSFCNLVLIEHDLHARMTCDIIDGRLDSSEIIIIKELQIMKGSLK